MSKAQKILTALAVCLAAILWGSTAQASAAAPAAVPARTTMAAAALPWPSSPVSWRNDTSGNCLSSKANQGYAPGNAYNVYALGCCQLGFTGCSALSETKWDDPSLGGGLYYEVLDNSWDHQSGLDSHDYCLDSNFAGSVYVIPCNGGDWEKWLELSTPTGWALQDFHTQLWLDGGGVAFNGIAGTGVYTNQNYGDNDHYQRWH